MNGGTGRVPRVVVGISRSRASWWALAWAVGEARRRGARLLLVHGFRPPVAPGAADCGQGGLDIPPDLYADRMAHGNALIVTAIDHEQGAPNPLRYNTNQIGMHNSGSGARSDAAPPRNVACRCMTLLLARPVPWPGDGVRDSSAHHS